MTEARALKQGDKIARAFICQIPLHFSNLLNTHHKNTHNLLQKHHIRACLNQSYYCPDQKVEPVKVHPMNLLTRIPLRLSILSIIFTQFQEAHMLIGYGSIHSDKE